MELRGQVSFFFNSTATTEDYTLSLHDALPIWTPTGARSRSTSDSTSPSAPTGIAPSPRASHSEVTPFSRSRSEEHTSELQSRQYLVCRLLLEKKNPLQYHSSLLHLLHHFAYHS